MSTQFKPNTFRRQLTLEARAHEMRLVPSEPEARLWQYKEESRDHAYDRSERIYQEPLECEPLAAAVLQDHSYGIYAVGEIVYHAVRQWSKRSR